MLEHYEKAAKALDIEIDKIMLDLVRPLVREELTREQRKKLKRGNEMIDCFELRIGFIGFLLTVGIGTLLLYFK
ncbi:MAG: hypothetical protein WBN72_10850 [Nitrososphaeraceae archaeon]